LRRPECLSEKRLKEVELNRRIDVLKNDILNRTSVQQKILLLNEQVPLVLLKKENFFRRH
jgi:hypothetical protein